MTRKMKRAAAATLGVAALGTLAWLTLRPAPLEVVAEPVTVGPLEVTVDEEGETRVRERFVVTAPIGGQLTRIALREGDPVRAGAPVARIVPAPLDSRAHEAAAARVEQAADALRAAEARTAQARAAHAQARRTSERLRELAGRNLVAVEERERAETETDARGRDLESAEFQARAAAHDVEVARAALLAGRGAEVVVRAPAAGRVLQLPERSERVVAAGTVLLELGDPSRIEVVVDLLSSDAVNVCAGQSLRIEAWGGAPITGRVRGVEPSGFTRVSALGVEEQRVNVIGEFERPAAALGDRFRVEVRIVTWAADSVLRVPVSALFRSGEVWAVYSVVAGRARLREVRIGHRGGAQAEVLSGLEAGDEVISYPDDRVRDGLAVRPR